MFFIISYQKIKNKYLKLVISFPNAYSVIQIISQICKIPSVSLIPSLFLGRAFHLEMTLHISFHETVIYSSIAKLLQLKN